MRRCRLASFADTRTRSSLRDSSTVCRSVLLKRAQPSVADGLPGRHDGCRHADGKEERHCPEKGRQVSGGEAIEEDGKDLPDANRQCEANSKANGHEPGSLPEHHEDDVPAWRAERETNGELPAPECHGIGRHTVDAHRGQQQRHTSHDSADGGEHALRRQAQRDRIGEWLRAGKDQTPVDVLNESRHRRHQAGPRRRRATIDIWAVISLPTASLCANGR